MAIAEASEELFVAELDRLRRMGMRAREVHGVISFPAEKIAPDLLNLDALDQNINHIAFEPNNSEIWPASTESPEDEEEWMHARRALLSCRELVRTERVYEENMQHLAEGDVRFTSTFSIMHNYAF